MVLCVQLFAQTPSPTKPSKPAPQRASLSEVTKAIEGNMVYVTGGTFTMGCTFEQDSCYHWEKPAHKVTVSNFFINKYPVTQREWETIMGNRPWFSKNCPDCPVEHVSWYDAQNFINTLNQATGKFYRLPTEAEWEYAARGGDKDKPSMYAGGDAADMVGWYENNSEKQTQPVGQKKANELGLYDMSGNVWQWCNDGFDEEYYKTSPAKDPQGPTKSTYKVCRGGSWWSERNDLRVSNRDRYPPDARDDDVGFRLAMD